MLKLSCHVSHQNVNHDVSWMQRPREAPTSTWLVRWPRPTSSTGSAAGGLSRKTRATRGCVKPSGGVQSHGRRSLLSAITPLCIGSWNWRCRQPSQRCSELRRACRKLNIGSGTWRARLTLRWPPSPRARACGHVTTFRGTCRGVWRLKICPWGNEARFATC